MKKPDITITINSGLDTHDIEFIQMFEKHMENSLLRVGYTQYASSKSGDKIELNYRQIAVLSPVHPQKEL